MESRISIITLGVEDLKKSTEFYKRLGFRLSKHSTEEIAFFELKGTWLALFPRDKLAEDANVNFGGNGYQSFTLAHNVKNREDVDALFQEIKRAGGVIVKQPQEAFWGGYSGYFKDPDGYLWELVWNPHFWPE